LKNTNHTRTAKLTPAQRTACLLKAAGVATAMLPLAWLSLVTPLGIMLVMLVGIFVLEPLDSLGFVDLGKSGEAMFIPNSLALALMVVPFWLLSFWFSFVLFRVRAEKAAAVDGTQTSGSIAPENVPQHGPVDAIDRAGGKLSIGDRVVIRAVESCLKELTKEERVRLRALVGNERSVVDLDRFGYVWLSFSASSDHADFCLSSRDVARVQ